MVMMSFFALNEIPFEKVYLHGMVLDKNGKKMSKSRGNGIDPLDMVEKYGADASRLALLVGSTPGNDVRFSEEKVADCRNFVNKLWNVSRFILMSVETRQGALKPKTLADKWIAEHLRKLVYTVGVALENNDFSFAGEAIREFMWSQLADWYLEVSKIQKRNDELLIYILETLLKLCHPFAPFVTEQIWHEMGRDKMLMIEKFPEEKEIRLSRASEDFGLLQKIIIEIRNWRAVQKVEPKEKINVTIFVRNKIVEENADIIKTLARLDKLTVDSGKKELGAAVYELKIDREFDLEKETARLEKERAKLEDYVVALDAKLSNEDFLKKAPAAVVEDGKKKLAEAKEKVAKIVGRLGEF
jgi:valyl-tRNA synthetase